MKISSFEPAAESSQTHARDFGLTSYSAGPQVQSSPGRQEVERCHDFTNCHPQRQSSASSQNRMRVPAPRLVAVVPGASSTGETVIFVGIDWSEQHHEVDRVYGDGASSGARRVPEASGKRWQVVGKPQTFLAEARRVAALGGTPIITSQPTPPVVPA